MVLYVSKYDLRPEKAAEYKEWAKTVINKILEVPGLIEFRGYRPITGDRQVAVTYEFPDMAAWVKWNSDPEIQKITNEQRFYAENIINEIWDSSPIVPEPLRPGK